MLILKKIEKNISQAGVYKSIFREEILEDLKSSENIIQLAYTVMVAGIVNLIPVGIPTLLGGVEYAFDNTIVKGVKKIIEKINGKKPKSFLESLDKCIEKIDERTYTVDKVETFTVDSTFDYENDTVKIMVWDSLSALKPLCEAVKIGK